MKRMRYTLIIGTVLALTMLGTAWAAESRDETSLHRDASAINAAATSPQGEKVVTARLVKEFGVTDAQIQALRGQKLGYGEIAIVLSLARNLSGGATDANIQQVMTLRQGPPTAGWGRIAQKLGVKLGPAVSQVRNVNRETNREMKRQAASGQKTMEQTREQHQEMQHEGMTGPEGMGQGMGGDHGMGSGRGR